MKDTYFGAIIAPDYDPGALEMTEKTQLAVLALSVEQGRKKYEIKESAEGFSCRSRWKRRLKTGSG